MSCIRRERRQLGWRLPPHTPLHTADRPLPVEGLHGCSRSRQYGKNASHAAHESLVDVRRNPVVKMQAWRERKQRFRVDGP